MSQLDLSALQTRAATYDLKYQRGRQQTPELRLFEAARLLSLQTNRLREAQLSPVVSSGTSVDPVAPILIENVACLLLMAEDLHLNLGQAMASHSEAHQQPLLASNTSHVQHMRKVLQTADYSKNSQGLTVPERAALHEAVSAMSWRVQTELQSRHVDIGASLEEHWANLYGFQQPTRTASKTATGKPIPAVS